MEELCFGALQHGRQDAEKCAAVLAMDHGADHLLHLAIDELSEGQRQLVCLLAVLIDRPETVLLDEPFTGLDHRLTGRLMQTLLRLPQRLIVATHRLELLENFEEVIWIEGGRVQMQGPANTVLPIYSRSGT
jgi:biotin transport system ATP-binding protein